MTLLTKKDILSSLICGEIASWLLIFIIKNPNIKELKGLAVSGNLVWFLLLLLPLIFLLGVIIAQFLRRFIEIVNQIIKFLEVGILNTFIDLGVLSILMSFSGIEAGWFYSLFKGISFITATTNSYFWNKLWTFQKKEFIQPQKEFVQFLVVSGIGFGINVVVASIVVNVIGSQFGLSPHLWGIIGAIVASLCGMIWNFLGYKFIVFKK